MNKRQLSRVDMTEWASVRYYDQLLIGDLENVSLQGLYFATDQKPPVNSLVKVDTPYSQISLHAHVVRHDPYGIGMKIVDIGLSSLLSLQRLIAEKSEDKQQYLLEEQQVVLRLQPIRQVKAGFQQACEKQTR